MLCRSLDFIALFEGSNIVNTGTAQFSGRRKRSHENKLGLLREQRSGGINLLGALRPSISWMSDHE